MESALITVTCTASSFAHSRLEMMQSWGNLNAAALPSAFRDSRKECHVSHIFLMEQWQAGTDGDMHELSLTIIV